MNDPHKHTEKHLFWNNSKEDIFKWISNLKYFTFFRGFGGFANDEDQFKLAMKYGDKADLISIIDKLRLENVDHQKLLNQGFSHCQIGNKKWCIHAGKDQIIFSPLNCQPYSACNSDYEACLVMEGLIESNGLVYRLNNEVRRELMAVTLEEYGNYFV